MAVPSRTLPSANGTTASRYTSPTAPSPLTTQKPTRKPRAEKDQPDRAPRICGFIDGDAAFPYICPESNVCSSDTRNGFVGCVSTASDEPHTALDAIATSCLDYKEYTSGYCDDVGPQTGCCLNEDYPFCVMHTYIGSPFLGYSLLDCGQSKSVGRALAWSPTTAGPSTVTQVLNGLNTNVTTTPIPKPTSTTPKTSPTPTPSPTTGSNSGLSISDKIALGTAIPSTFLSLVGIYLAWRYRQKRNTNRADKPTDEITLLPVGKNESEDPL
ncbi:hypothetical protein F5Y19DRAFT_257570 [Xylariaceae sp. FL1651]|nr:hypothetical protein F5Y19DRAFT_257570 [Xylariaceae sp. FL1651]